MKKIITVFLVLAASFGMAAKNNPREINGKVYDETGAPMPYVTVALMSLPDSSIVGGTTTDLDGVYNIQTELSKGLLMFSMLGYDDVYADFASAGEIHMKLSDLLLGEAVVKATMPKTKLTGDGMITSVKGSVLENVGTANDALARIPGLIRNQSGGLEVIGKGSPIVYINGRKVTDPRELESLQSFEIQSIEVINNPGAQYDATVKSVVRIKTVRRQGEGFGFNLGLTDEQSLKYRDANDPSGYLNANWRRGSLDIFAGVSRRDAHETQDSHIYQENRGDRKFGQDGTLIYSTHYANTGLNGGFNWQLADNHFIGARVESYVSPFTDVHQELDNDIMVDGVKTEHVFSVGDHTIDNKPSSIRTNVYYNGQAGKLGVDFNADYYQTGTSQLAHTVESSSLEDDVVNSASHTDSKLYAAKLVLSYPIWKGGFEAGTEETFTRTHNDYSIVNDIIPSSGSEMSEDNIALFAQYAFYLPKLGQFSAGLRYEHVDYSYDDKFGSEDLSKTYDNLFPSLSFATQVGKVQGSLSYSVKTQRPDFSQLSSAIMYHSRYIIQSGNAMLQPMTNHELAMNLHWEFLTFVTQYAKQVDPILSWSSLYSDDGMIILRPRNIEDPLRSMACYVNASPTIGIWTMNYTAGMQTQWLEMDVPVREDSQETLHLSFSHRPMWIAQLNNTFSFKNNWRVDLSGEYHSKAFAQNAAITNNYFYLTMALEKALLKDRSLVIRLQGSNLTGMARNDVEMNCGGHIIRQTNDYDTKRLTLSLRYNFNAAQSKYRGTGAGNEARSRM